MFVVRAITGRQQAQLQATQAVTAAVARLDGGETDPQVVLVPRLVVRTSTGAPRPR